MYKIVGAAALLLATILISPSTSASAGSARRVSTTFFIPAGNLPGTDPVASDTALVYGVTNPLNHKSNADHPYTGYHVRVYARKLALDAGRLVASPARLLFVAPRGLNVAGYSVAANRFVYVVYNGSQLGFWQLRARNLTTGRNTLIDSNGLEHLPSLFGGARSDGSMVTWVAWTRNEGSATSVLRTYDFATGKSAVIARGGSENTWAYATPDISGQWVVFARQEFATRKSQIFGYNVRTRVTRKLSRPSQVASEPGISGNLVGWKVGWQWQGSHGLEVYRLNTRLRTYIRAPGEEGVAAAGGRYLVFTSNAPNAGDTDADLYDAVSGTTRVLAGPPVSANSASSYDLAAGDTISIGGGGPVPTCAPHACPIRFTIVQLS